MLNLRKLRRQKKAFYQFIVLLVIGLLLVVFFIVIYTFASKNIEDTYNSEDKKNYRKDVLSFLRYPASFISEKYVNIDIGQFLIYNYESLKKKSSDAMPSFIKIVDIEDIKQDYPELYNLSKIAGPHLLYIRDIYITYNSDVNSCYFHFKKKGDDGFYIPYFVKEYHEKFGNLFPKKLDVITINAPNNGDFYMYTYCGG